MFGAMVGGGAPAPGSRKSVWKGFPSSTESVPILVGVLPRVPTERARQLCDRQAFFASGAAPGRGRCGAVVRPREGRWEGFWAILGGIFFSFVPKLRQSAGNLSQMGSACVMDVCGALARVSVLPELEKPPKLPGNQEPESKSVTGP